MNFVKVLLVVVAGFVSLVGCSQEMQDTKVKIGVLLGFTGETAAGFSYERAMHLAAKKINDSGGILGHTVELVARDTGSDPVLAIERAAELVNDPSVLAIIGPDDPKLALQVAFFLAAKDRIHLVGGAMLPDPALIDDTGAYGVGPNTKGMTCALAERIVKDGFKRIAILHTEHVFQKYFAINVENQLSHLNATVGGLHVARFLVGADGFADVTENQWIDSTLAFHPDAILLAAEPKRGMDVVTAWSVVVTGQSPRWYFSPTSNHQFFVDNIPASFVDGAVAVGPSFGTSGEYAQFADDFRKTWDDDPFVSASYFYDGLTLLALAMEAAGRQSETIPSKQAIAEQLQGIANAGNAKTFSWNEIEGALNAVRAGEAISFRGVTGDLTVSDGWRIGAADSDVNYWRIDGNKLVYDAAGFCADNEE